MGVKVTNPKAEEAKKHIVEKLQAAVGRMMFVQEEVEQLLKDIPRRQKPQRRRYGPSIRFDPSMQRR